jgi:two-component sensor histidine kinase
MIVNELASLSIYHSLADAPSGTVEVAMREEGEEFVITTSDNGSDPFEGESSGSPQPEVTILRALVSKLDGAMMIHPGTGMSVEVRFTPKAPYTG